MSSRSKEPSCNRTDFRYGSFYTTGVELRKPPRLQPGDTIAALSLSSGLAAKYPHRFEAGKRQLKQSFGVRVVEAPHALCDDDWLYRNPQARADDLHWALTNPEVKGIVSIIGGYESVRILPYLDVALIRQHPKVFLGSSDATVQHFAFFKAGVVSFYGPSMMTDIAESGGMLPYVTTSLRRALFAEEAPWSLQSAEKWTEEYLDWGKPELQLTLRTLQANPGWVWLQGAARAEGHLLGGCLEVLEMLKGTRWWPPIERWRGAIFYFETSEEAPPPRQVEYWLRNYASQGILEHLAGILIGRPMRYSAEATGALYAAVKKVLAEVGRRDMPVVANLDFGHTSPAMTLPNGCRAAIDPLLGRIEVLEPGVS
jgi:muramoyltetrapeptide carboxypeptidase LdcA involved in peptidoglycan recycling